MEVIVYVAVFIVGLLAGVWLMGFTMANKTVETRRRSSDVSYGGTDADSDD